MSYRVLDSCDGLPRFRCVDGREWGITQFQIYPVKNTRVRKIGVVDVVQFGIEYSWRAFEFRFTHNGFASKKLRDDNEWLAKQVVGWLRENVPCYAARTSLGECVYPTVVNFQ